MHRDLAFAGADNLGDEIAHRDRHLPPAFLPSTDAARSPDIGVFIQAIARAARHGAQRVTDQVDGFVEDRELFSPFQQWVGHPFMISAQAALAAYCGTGTVK